MFVEGKSRTVFFPSDTLIYGISRDGSQNFNIHTCEHMILGQLRMGSRQAKNAPLVCISSKLVKILDSGANKQSLSHWNGGNSISIFCL